MATGTRNLREEVEGGDLRNDRGQQVMAGMGGEMTCCIDHQGQKNNPITDSESWPELFVCVCTKGFN